MGAFVDHQIVGFGETPLAVLADELALWSHFTTKVRPTVVVIDSHHRKHRVGLLELFVVVGCLDLYIYMLYRLCMLFGCFTEYVTIVVWIEKSLNRGGCVEWEICLFFL